MALTAKVEEAVTRQEGWPKSPRALSGHLRDLAPNLRAVGLGVEFSRQAGSGRRRLIIITRITGRDRPDRPDRPEDADSSAKAAEPGTQRDGEADRRDATPEPSVPASKRERDERDGGDANGGLLEDGSEQVEDQMLRAAPIALPGSAVRTRPTLTLETAT